MDEQPNGAIAQIMVVDDDPDTVTVLARYLQREGFATIEAMSGPQCLRLVDEYKVDVILLDLMMPEMDGFEVVRALKSNPATAEIPIIMITARDDIEARSEGMRVGVSDFLAKPVFRKQLANRIKAQLDTVATARSIDDALSRIEMGAETPNHQTADKK
ncbi:MAG TPA: response regulator [Candidatus Binataceae bacterium]|nr:response regulator [Candidatus Binataceae bacterium]